MDTHQERRLGELAENILQLTDRLPTWLDSPPAEDLQTFEELENAATDLWTLWRDLQVKRDLATCRQDIAGSSGTRAITRASTA